MPNLLVDVYNASGNLQGPGPLAHVKNVSIRRPLDGVGQVSFSVPATDRRALDLALNERRVKIWAQVGDTGKRLIGQGIIRNKSYSESSGSMTRTFSGPDIMDELKRKNTWLARTYKQQTLSTVVNDLIGLVSGWTATIDPSVSGSLVEARFDGVSVLKALQHVIQQVGAHFRLGTTDRELEVGLFGAADGRRINRVTRVTPEMQANDKLLLVQQLQVQENSSQIYNTLAPIGAGEGIAALTLEKSTRSSPYTIQSLAMPDGGTLYYLRNSASVTAYGAIERMGQFKDIAPLSNSNADIVNAANALYDAAVVWLDRHKDPQESYSATLKNIKTNIQPGSKLNVRYKGQVVNQDGETVDFVDLDGDFWVMEVSETVNQSGVSANVQLSNVDRYERGAADVVIGAIESIQMRGLRPQQTSSTRTYIYPRELDPAYSAIVPIEFTDATLYLNRVRIRIKTTPFRATAQGAAAGGDHDHKMFGYINSTLQPDANTYSFKVKQMVGGTLQDQNILASIVPSVNADLYTFGASGDHTHPLIYAIQDDSQYPGNVQVWIDGIDRTAALGGPWGTTSSGIDIVLDETLVTGYIQNAAGGLQQVHTVEIRCAAGQGRVEVTVEVFEVNQSIRLL